MESSLSIIDSWCDEYLFKSPFKLSDQISITAERVLSGVHVTGCCDLRVNAIINHNNNSIPSIGSVMRSIESTAAEFIRSEFSSIGSIWFQESSESSSSEVRNILDEIGSIISVS